MRKPKVDMGVFKERRDRLKDLAPGCAFLLSSAEELHWMPYRQDSNFYYLTGFDEPGSIALIRPGMDPEYVLFVQPKDPAMEIWDGYRYGQQGVVSEFGADKGILYSEFDKEAVEMLIDVDKLYFSLGNNAEMDRKVYALLDKTMRARGRTGKTRLPIHDPNDILGEMRVIKSPYEQDCMRESCRLSAQAHIEAMKFTKPGVTERQVLGVLMHRFFQENALREGYHSIVASGANACTLHYRFNDDTCKDGDVLLIDAGAEKNYYTADITRTFPINGKFSGPQKEIYDAVLKAQKEVISSLKVGMAYFDMQKVAVKSLTESLVSLGLLRGDVNELIETHKYRKYYPHNIGHFLGMDVHDVGLYAKANEGRPLEAGMAFTVEPGLYVPVDDTEAPEEFRGIGVRIEDDILLTASGPEIMTKDVPKERDEVEAVCNS